MSQSQAAPHLVFANVQHCPEMNSQILLNGFIFMQSNKRKS